MDAIKILLVDDDTGYGDILTVGLQTLGYEVYYQSSYTSIIPTINEVQPSIIVLDVEIGAKDGIDESSQIISFFDNIPVIFISSHTDPEYVERAMSRGAVYYLKKPFHVRELAAIINRYACSSVTAIAIGDLSINTETHIMRNLSSNKQHKLSQKECKLLMLLIQNIGQSVSRKMIDTSVWGDQGTTEAVINNTISKLRKYIAEDTTLSIKTINKIGYRLDSTSFHG